MLNMVSSCPLMYLAKQQGERHVMPTTDKEVLKRASARYRQKKNMTTIAVTAEIKARLLALKDKEDAQTMSEVIDNLLCDLDLLSEEKKDIEQKYHEVLSDYDEFQMQLLTELVADPESVPIYDRQPTIFNRLKTR